MSAVVTAHALLTAHGEGAAALSTPTPWTQVGAHRGALWPGVASEVCAAISPRVEQRDRASAHALLVAHRLFAGLAGGLHDPTAVGVVLGTALGCGSVNDAYHRSLVAGRASPMLFGYTVPSAPVGEVAQAFGLRGHQSALMAGRSSGLVALAEARRAIALGRAPAVLVLASDALSLDRIALLGEQGEPDPIEASVALLIEHEAHAREHGRAPLARLHSAGLAPDPSAAAGLSYLGASGVVELSAALAAGLPPDGCTVSAGGPAQRAWARLLAPT